MKLLMLIKTSGLDYDDRLRKEVLSLTDLGLEVKIVALEYANRAESKTVYGRGSATTIRLRSRDWFERTKGLAFKLLEMYLHFFVHTVRERPDIVWLHNLELSALAPVIALLRRLGFVKRLVWDQHELPSDATLQSSRKMRLFARLINSSDVVVMANEERHGLIRERFPGAIHTPVKILDNYPDMLFRDLPAEQLPEAIVQWLGGAPYLLAQGGANPERHLSELIAAVLSDRQAKLIVVGPYHPDLFSELDAAHGSCWREYITFTGFLPQLQIPSYIDGALASVIFYTVDNENNRLCAPNRLYQALTRGVPIIVGPNPPMSRIVNNHGCGIIVDHADPVSIRRGIRKLRDNHTEYRARAEACVNLFNWDDQLATIKEIVS